MKRENLLLLVLGLFGLGYVYTKRSQISDTASNVGATVTAAFVGWKNVGSGPQWLPYLNQAEAKYNLPADLLARIAYQESHFREDIIRGTLASSAGALGMMQMMPQYFPVVNAPRPYTDLDVTNQIDAAGAQMASLYRSTNDWSLAIAAYNAGLGNVRKYAGIPPFPETQTYVAKVMADVPSLA